MTNEEAVERGLVADLVSASELYASDPSAEGAVDMLVSAAGVLLRRLGYGVHALEGVKCSHVRGPDPAYRVISSTDYVIRDLKRAAEVLRAQSRRLDELPCTPEPLEDDPMGLLRDLLDLARPRLVAEPAVGVLRSETDFRALTAAERQSYR